MQINKINDLYMEIRIPYRSMKTSSYFHLCSDVHFDNPDSDQKLFFSHLDKIKSLNGKSLIFGDFLCLMQGKYDLRSDKSKIRPEHNKSNYLDAVLDDTADKLKPYKKTLGMISLGNHETRVIERNEIDPLHNLALRLKGLNTMGYHGFIKFIFHNNGSKVRSCLLYFHHGKWGSITSSVNKHGLSVPQADIIVSGHTHSEFYVPVPRLNLRQNGEVSITKQHHIKCGTYKDEFLTTKGFGVERIAVPKNIGSWLLKLTPTEKDVDIKFESM